MTTACVLRRFALLAFVVASTVAAQQPANLRPLSIEDLYRVDRPRSAAASPDNSRVAFVRQWIDPKTKRERNSLWIADRSGAKAMEAGEPDARSPVFSPDGRWIAFLSTRVRPDGRPIPPVPEESDAAVDLWLIPAAGGPAVPLAGEGKPFGRVFHDGFYGRVAFSSDGARLAFTADDGKDPRTKEELDADVEILRPDQGEGYAGYGTARVWVAELDPRSPSNTPPARIKQLTHDDAWYADPQWTPDGKTLIVCANRTPDRESVRYSINKNYDLFALDASTGSLRRLTHGVGPDVSPRVSPDGKRVAYLSVPRKGSHRDSFNLCVLTLDGSGATSTTVFDHHGPGADHRANPSPSFPLPDDCWDGPAHVIAGAAVGVDSATVRIDLRTGMAQRLSGDTRPAAVARRELVPTGDQFLKQCRLGEVRTVRWDNEGMSLEGLLTLPGDPAIKAPYKVIVNPHGGPHSRTATGFNFFAQVFAAHGYAVFQPNFRGSEGYGQAFLEADRFDFGGGDARDVLSGVDHLVREKLADPDRLFVYGTSYGGFMTTWLVGHTDRFKAAVSQNGVTDLNAMWFLSDIPSWTGWEFGGLPWEVPGAMRKHSPLTWVAQVKTPTLILHAREDRRVPIANGLAFHRALLAREVPTQMVMYPAEGHGIRRPRHQEDVLRRVLAWFAKYGK